MTAAPHALDARAADLRAAFDRSFALPHGAEAAAALDLIAVRVGSEPCAIRLSEVAGLFVDRRTTPVPGGQAALLGIAGFRGALLPVYGLARLLGTSTAANGARGEAATQPRWLAIAAAAPVAFEAFEGHLRIGADTAMSRQQSRGPLQDVAREFIRTGDVVRAVLHLPSIVALLAQSAAQGVFKEEN